MSFDLQKLEKYIKILTDNYKLKLNDLEKHSDIKDSYEHINNITIDDNVQDDLVLLISKQYRPSQIMPDTVGSFLFGCFQQTYGDIPSECSPLCAYSINNGENVSMQKCDSQIYIQYLDDPRTGGPGGHGGAEDQRFIKLGNSSSPQGYIFVKLNFLGFTLQEKEYFKEQGIYRIQVLVTKDSKHHTVLRMRNLDEIPVIEKSGSNYYINSSSAMNTEDAFKEGAHSTSANEATDEDVTYVYIILAIIIIGVMIAVSRN